MKIKLNKNVKTALKIIISVAALFFVFNKIEFNEVMTIYKQSNLGFLLFALLLFALSKFVAAFRLNHFLKAIDINISHSFNLKLYILGMFYNLFLPGGIGGDGYKVFLLNKQFGTKSKRIIAALLFDRLSGMLALFILTCGLAYFIDIPLVYKYFIWAAIPLSVLGFYLVVKYLSPVFTKLLPLVSIQSLVVQSVQVVCAWFILKGIGIQNMEIEYLFVFLISSVVATLPITIGGIGSREITFLYGAEFMGLETDSSVALSLMFYIITALVSFFGIYYSINTKKLED